MSRAALPEPRAELGPDSTAKPIVKFVAMGAQPRAAGAEESMRPGTKRLVSPPGTRDTMEKPLPPRFDCVLRASFFQASLRQKGPFMASSQPPVEPCLAPLLDSDDKRTAALQLVLAWQLSQVLGSPCDSLAEISATAEALFTGRVQTPQSPPQQLIAMARSAGAAAMRVGELCADVELRARCFVLARHCQGDAARIERQLLWSVES
jgi:hypothetical protein